MSLGYAPNDVRRLLRRRELVVYAPGIYLDHTGDPTWLQRAWGAVLSLWPAALCHESALQAAGAAGRRTAGPLIDVAVDRDRSPGAPPGVRLHRLADLDAKVLWQLSPPHVRVEEAAIDVASGARDDYSAVAVLADAVQSRRTSATRMATALDGRSRIARRDYLAAPSTAMSSMAPWTGSSSWTARSSTTTRPTVTMTSSATWASPCSVG